MGGGSLNHKCLGGRGFLNHRCLGADSQTSLIPYSLNIFRQNIRDAILTIAQAMGNIDPPLTLDRPESVPSHEFILHECPATDFDYPPEFWEHTERLWDDPAMKKCYERSNEYQLIDSAKYFLDKVGEVRKDDYNPSEQDILR